MLLLVWWGRWCGRGWWSVSSRLFVLIGGLVFGRSRGSAGRRLGLGVTTTRSGTGVLMMLVCLGWGLWVMGRGRGLLGGCVW